MNLALTREPELPDCTFGKLTAAANIFDTMEPIWVEDLDGAAGGDPDISCVPLGTYQLALHDTADHPKTFALVNPALGVYHEPADIPQGEVGRFGCLLHALNYAWQSKGCIGVGLGRDKSEPMITQSDKALAHLLALVPWVSGHTLQVRS